VFFLEYLGTHGLRDVGMKFVEDLVKARRRQNWQLQ